MDRALYVAMTGATQTMRAQTANNNNIANASTVGFRAELASFMAAQVEGPGQPTRVNTIAGSSGWDSTEGGIIHTGNPMDVALRGNSWLAVQAPDGSEAYTRAGDLRVNSLGQVTNAGGHLVLGDGGLISIPPSNSITIGADGTISVVPQGQTAATLATVGRLKVVEAKPEQLERGADGLMRAKKGETLQPAAGNVVMSSSLESSNVNLAGSMVNMIELARQFEMQVKLMKTAEDNAKSSASLVRMNG